MKVSLFNTAVSLVTVVGVHCLGNERPAVSQLSSRDQPNSEDSNMVPWYKRSIEERIQCKLSNKCKRRNGKCIPKDLECDGDIFKRGCKSKSCKGTHVCCAPKQCKPSKKCNEKNGKCIPIHQECNGEIINNGCKKRKSCKETHVCCAPPDILSVDEFISNFDKTYANEEEKNKRIGIFRDNVKSMKDHNELYESGDSTFKMGVNEYSDMTYDEVVNELTGIKASDIVARHKRSDDWYVPKQLGQEPNSMDYRDKGAVNPIRNQGSCGSCWAFSVTSSIESNIFLQGGSLLQLSEQDLVDCSTPYGPQGCRGGWPETAIKYVIDEGISYRDEYPYTARDDTCKQPATKAKNVIAYKKVRPGSEDELLNALVHIGPISICMFVSSNFMSYKRGVLFDTYCTSGNRVNHAMTLVGYGTENGQDYWLIRNSWGGSWGDNGYIKVARNQANHCWISSYGDIPVIQGKDETIETCVNRNTQCTYWANIGECQKNPGYMLVYCKQACNVCGKDETIETCVNRDTQCTSWANIGECQKNPGYMLVYCKQACNACD